MEPFSDVEKLGSKADFLSLVLMFSEKNSVAGFVYAQAFSPIVKNILCCF